MALQVRELDQLIRHKLDADATAAMAPIAIVNEAGRLLVSLRPWGFQLRPAATVGLVAAQEYLSLPASFGRFAGKPATHPSAGRVRVLAYTTYAKVLELRATLNPGSNIDGQYAGALVWAPNVSADGGAPTPRLEIWPPPGTTDASAFLLPYYADWDERTTDEQFVNLPEYAEGLMRHLVRETAAGYENDDQESVWDRIAEIKESEIYKAVVMADAGAQSDLGPIMGGAAATVAGERASIRSPTFYPVPIP